MTDLFSQPPPAARTNVPELSVSELALSLKKTLEDTYGRVRVRGELSKVKIHSSGHMYTDLKDADACLAAVCWKGSLAKLGIRPEEGLEVICTGRITTYPQRSNYQLMIETMELAGEGALLKMLDDRRKRLAAEGLFDASRKRPLPFIPQRIGVVTSPTGAVIRDILHRLEDRFPRPVLVWPVLVQGPGAAEQVANAVRGFDAMTARRPDLLIVARGGGSLEDLMPFNDEGVVRAVAACRIPVISAVGHETDTTLIDHVADVRAPTPTAAAEMAVPVRAQLYAQVMDDASRAAASIHRLIVVRRDRAEHVAARLGDPRRLLELRAQRLDHAAHRLTTAFDKMLQSRRRRWQETAARLPHPEISMLRKKNALQLPAQRLDNVYGTRLEAIRARILRNGAVRPPRAAVERGETRLQHAGTRLHAAALPDTLLRSRRREIDHAERMLETLSFKSVLRRGFAVVRDAEGRLVAGAAGLEPGQAIAVEFADGIVDATVGQV